MLLKRESTVLFPAVGLGVVPEAGVLRLSKIQPLMLRGEAQRSVQKMTELMDRGLGVGDIDDFLSIAGSTDAGHIKAVAEICHEVKVDSVGPASFIERRKDGFRYTAQLQQKVICMDPCWILQRHRSGRRFHRKALRQDGVEQLYRLTAGDDLTCRGISGAKLKLTAHAQVIVVGR